jgi:uncharacterized membrane protein YedE/YeeE
VQKALEKVKEAPRRIVWFFQGLGQRIGQVVSRVNDFLTAPFRNAWSFIRQIPGHIASIFSGLHISLPHINLPHFSVHNWSWNPADWIKNPPSLHIDWYAKAMRNGMLLNGATIFGSMGSRLLGGGETGREWVVGEDSLMGKIRAAVGDASGTVYNIAITVNPSAGMDERELADMVARRIQQQVDGARAVWA